MNDQIIEKQHLRDDGALYVHSIWNTIQGEGPLAGTPATFVRLAGCNLRCHLCDTEYTKRDLIHPVTILSQIQCAPPHPRLGRLVVITGGEPFRQNIATLMKLLVNSGLRVQIETNGTLYVPGVWGLSTIICSPKTGTLNKYLIPYISAYKYVISEDDVNEEDGLPNHVLGSKSPIARPPKNNVKPIYVQPIDTQDIEENKAHLQAAIDSCMKFGYILSLQTHKIIGMP